MAGSNNAAGVQSVLDTVVAEAEAAAVRLETRRQDLLEQLRETNEELRLLTKVVNAARPSEKATKKKTARKQVSNVTGLNTAAQRAREEALELGREAVRKVVEQGTVEFNSSDLKKAGLTPSQAGSTLVKLRDLGEIRYVGERKNTLGGRKPFKTYSLVS